LQRQYAQLLNVNLEKTKHPCKHYEKKNYETQNNHTKTTCKCRIDTSASNIDLLKRAQKRTLPFLVKLWLL